MKIFADLHHQSLYHSLHLLFEKRLGHELYRAIGPEWYPDYWQVYDHLNTVQQFLGYHQGNETPKDVHGAELPEYERKNLNYTVEDGIYYVFDPVYNTNHRAISLEKFCSMDFDILISSIPQHIPRFNRLIAESQLNAKHIFQVGNAWGRQPGVSNILSSTAPFAVPDGINVCFYHQEFDIDTYKYEPPKFHNVVNSYVHYMKRPELMDQVAALFSPGWSWTKHGAGFAPLSTADAVALAMKNSAFTWHFKPEGDGYGHVIHSTYACGRPAIVDKAHYAGKLADSLLIPDHTCIDIHGLNTQQIAEKISFWSQPDNHMRMCDNAYKQFMSIVDFNAEQQLVTEFLERLV